MVSRSWAEAPPRAKRIGEIQNPVGGNKSIGRENATIRGSEVHSRQGISFPATVRMGKEGAVEKEFSGNWAWIVRS